MSATNIDTTHSAGSTSSSAKASAYFGLFNYSDEETQTTPISVSAGGNAYLSNDAQNPLTNKTFAPDGISDVWDADTNEFDFSQCPNGSQVHFRVDLEITITGTNADIQLVLEAGIGGFAYELTIESRYYKSAGTYNFTAGNFLYIGDDNTRLNPAKLKLYSSNNTDVKVNGWSAYVHKYND